MSINQNSSDKLSNKFIVFVNILLNSFIYFLLSYNSVVTANNREVIEDAWIFESTSDSEYTGIRLYLTVSAQRSYVEVSWENAPANADDRILLTKKSPYFFEKVPPDSNRPTFSEDDEGSGEEGFLSTTAYNIRGSPYIAKDLSTWTFNEDNDGPILLSINPLVSTQWFTTGIQFEFNEVEGLTVNTTCYGYWASYVNGSGHIQAKTCYRIFPTWMNDIRNVVGKLKLRDLMIPGTHDSGSYRRKRQFYESLFVKYSVTQDDDVYTQLLNGVRYLDLRVGYYRHLNNNFYINHGITKHKPLIDIIEQIIEFVTTTHEIVIVGFKEFPVGFGRNNTIHNKLVHFLHTHMKGLIVKPSLGYGATLEDIWRRQEYIILAYDKIDVVLSNPEVLFPSVEQRWANAQTWNQLESFLVLTHYQNSLLNRNRPVSDMAELTPDAWGVVTDRYGGLRVMADETNWRISLLYRGALAATTNIVSTDFHRGNTIINLAMEFNRRRKV